MSQTRTVAKIEKTWSNGALRWELAWAVFAGCGHSVDAVKREHQATRAAHDDANLVLRPGDTAECDRCPGAEEIAEAVAFTKAPGFAHSRFRHDDSRGFGPGSVFFYVRDPKSPTGVLCELSMSGSPELMAALRGGTSPLSPTEGLPRSGAR
jgi:hypothetical protein